MESLTRPHHWCISKEWNQNHRLFSYYLRTTNDQQLQAQSNRLLIQSTITACSAAHFSWAYCTEHSLSIRVLSQSAHSLYTRAAVHTPLKRHQHSENHHSAVQYACCVDTHSLFTCAHHIWRIIFNSTKVTALILAWKTGYLLRNTTGVSSSFFFFLI